MKMISFCIAMVFCFLINVNAQGYRDMPGYTPLIPKLWTLNHKAESNTYDPEKITTERIISKALEENINIYVVYQTDNSVGKSNFDAEVINPPAKLMDFQIIYNYRYLIPYTSLDKVNNLLSNISIGSSDKLTKIKSSNYFIENGKIKCKKINNKQITSGISSNEVEIKFHDFEFASNSLIELIVEITSYNFNSLSPSFNNKEKFKRNLILSMPSIFQYEFADTSFRYELVSEKNKPFQLLYFNRGSKDWDKIIETSDVNCKTYVWAIPPDASALTNFSLNLKSLAIPSQNDIGVPIITLLMSDK